MKTAKLFEPVHQSVGFIMMVVGIIAGTILGMIFKISFFGSPVWLIVAALLLVLSYFCSIKIILILPLIAGMLIAGCRISLELTGGSFIQQFVGQNVEISGTVCEDEDTDESGTTIKIDQLKINGKETAGKIYVKMSSNSEIRRSYIITLKGKLTAGFGVYAGALYRPSIISLKKPSPESPITKTRDFLSEQISRYLPEKEASLGLAYLLGLKNNLSPDLMELLRVVGLTHIVVASGTHLGILVGIARKIFGEISRFAGLLFSLLFITAFATMVGWTASITRAAIVSAFSIIAWYFGRTFRPLRLILIAMAITLLINPANLVNLGWLLSFGSFFGIMILGPKLTNWFFKDEKPHFVAEIIITTIAATLMCAPILLYFFGTISIISLVANLLILPTIPYAMGLTMLTGILGWCPFLPNITGWLTTILLKFHLFVIEFFGAQTMFLIEIPAENPLVFLLYLPIFAPLIYGIIKRWKLSLKPKC